MTLERNRIFYIQVVAVTVLLLRLCVYACMSMYLTTCCNFSVITGRKINVLSAQKINTHRERGEEREAEIVGHCVQGKLNSVRV